VAHSDLAVVGGSVWTPDGFMDSHDVLISGESIAEVVPSGSTSTGKAEIIDAEGLLVIPGLIDTHSHHREPGFTHKEDIASASRAAAVGGVTVTVGMPNVDPPTTTVERFEEVLTRYAQSSVVDYNHNPSPTNLAEIPGLAGLGCLGFKLFMVVDGKRSYPHMPGLGIHDHADIARILEVTSQTGRPLMVHPNDQALLELIEHRHWEAESLGPEPYSKAEWMFDGAVWNSAVATLIEIQRGVGGPLHILHMMSDRTVELIRRAKKDGQDVTAEVNAFALFLGDWQEVAHLGPYALGRCLKDEWRAALWSGIFDGTIDVLGTDHAPHTKEEKEPGWKNMWATPTGTPQLQHYLSKLLDASHQDLISLDGLVRLTSYNPAKRFGLYPKKGTIERGADADLVLVDYDREYESGVEEVVYSKAGYNPYAGQSLRGRPVMTLVRGQVVAKDGRAVGDPGYGKQAVPVTPGLGGNQ